MLRLAFSRTLMTQSAASLTINSIGGLLRANDVEVNLCLLGKNHHFNARKLIKDFEKYPILLLKINFQDYVENLGIAIELKKMGICKRIFVCGPFASLNFERVMNTYKEVDGVILGEGEETTLELIKSISKDQTNFTWDVNIFGGVWRDPTTQKVVRTKNRSRTIPLDEMPLPIRDIEKKENALLANLELSRGCIASCSFCHIPAMRDFQEEGSKFNVKSTETIMQEIEYLRYDLNKKFLIFNDSIFWGSKKDDKRIIEFAEEIIKRKIDIWFMIYLRCNPFPSDEVLSILKKAGLVRVFVGVESATKETLKLYNKGIKTDTWSVVKNKLDNFGISYHIGFIVFHPFSTIEDLQININYLHQIDKLFRVGVILEKMRLIPGSGMDTKKLKTINDLDVGVDQAYNYTFNNPFVAILFTGFNKMFKEVLHSKHEKAEFFCTNTNLAVCIVQREENSFKSTYINELSYFEEQKKDYQSLLHKYFNVCIEGVSKQQWLEEDITSIKRHSKFIEDFGNQYIKLQVAWANIMEIIRRDYDESIVNSLFTGEEQI